MMGQLGVSETKGLVSQLSQTQYLEPSHVLAMAASFGFSLDDRLNNVPYLWHWLYFPNLYPMEQAGEDGHQAKGHFLPAIDLPRRMWAGGRLRFETPLRLNAEAHKKSNILSVTHKKGKAGELAFVKVAHEITQDQQLCIYEEHDIVYREDGQLLRYTDVPADWQPIYAVEHGFNQVQLFRYSALTFNSHRIHYDKPYAIEKELYKGLVVHGPLIATALLETFLTYFKDIQVLAFEFQAISPLFDGESAMFCVSRTSQLNQFQLWAARDTQLIMKALVTTH